MKYCAIIVGGGSGSRMQQQKPKQFLELNGKPILMHTLEAFYHSTLQPEIFLVLNVHAHVLWEDLCKQYHFTIPHTLIKGGEERFHSVKNGLKAIKGDAIVAIHDAVRPLVSSELITKSYQQAEELGNAVVGIPAKDSVRQLKTNGSEALDRNSIYLMQTPQTFKLAQLKKAYEQEFRNDFTDDASVVERAGFKIHLLKGEAQNIKITFPEDLIYAETILKVGLKS
jgi:2-C-methyl-D-erythritol 4-phosphate cytidylyltransferase